jgi:hypothetical protein
MELDDDAKREHTGKKWVTPESKDLLAMLSAAIWIDVELRRGGEGSFEHNIEYALKEGYE